MPGDAVWACSLSDVHLSQHRAHVVLCDADGVLIDDDIIVLRCQAVGRTCRLADLEIGIEHVELISESRVGALRHDVFDLVRYCAQSMPHAT